MVKDGGRQLMVIIGGASVVPLTSCSTLCSMVARGTLVSIAPVFFVVSEIGLRHGRRVCT